MRNCAPAGRELRGDLAGGLGVTLFALGDFLDDVAADFFAAEVADGAKIGLTLDDGQPG